MKRVEWRRHEFGHHGYVGGIRLFQVSWGLTSDKAKPWVLRANLPGMKESHRTATVEDAQVLAERLLQRFVSKIGAAFEATPQDA